MFMAAVMRDTAEECAAMQDAWKFGAVADVPFCRCPIEKIDIYYLEGSQWKCGCEYPHNL